MKPLSQNESNRCIDLTFAAIGSRRRRAFGFVDEHAHMFPKEEQEAALSPHPHSALLYWKACPKLTMWAALGCCLRRRVGPILYGGVPKEGNERAVSVWDVRWIEIGVVVIFIEIVNKLLKSVSFIEAQIMVLDIYSLKKWISWISQQPALK